MALRTHKTTGSTLPHAVRLLVAKIGPSCFAFPADWVRGIVTPTEAGTDLVVTWAGATYERTDLGARLGCSSHPNDTDSRMILYGNNDRTRAFSVDSVVGLVDVLRHDIRPLPPHFRGSERQRLIGLSLHDSYIALITNPFWVLGLPSGKDDLAALAQPVSQYRSPETAVLQLTASEPESALSTGGKAR
jgi:hypothetical protein